jgi:predicted acetyltransferase
MPELSLPAVAARQSFLAAMDEFKAEGRGNPADMTMVGREIRAWTGRWATPEGFAAFVADLRADALDETPRPAHLVPCTTWWWLDGDEYLGRIALRHVLNPRLLETGGHIGYDVRPTARRRGHATAMLARVLPIAHARGIDPVLITCEPGNVASRRVIEASGGVFQDERKGLRRYWVPTASRLAQADDTLSGLPAAAPGY